MQTLKNKIYFLLILPLLATGFMIYLALFIPGVALAADDCKTNARPGHTRIVRDDQGRVIDTKKIPGKTATEAEINKCLKDNTIIKTLNRIIRILSGIVGIAIVGGIIWGGVQYVRAGNNPNDITKAKQHILNAVIALLFFIFLYAFLQWVIPGGEGLGLLDL